MFSRLLVPLDGSSLAEAILLQVMELATLHGAEVVLLRVAHAHAILDTDEIEAQVRAVQEANARTPNTWSRACSPRDGHR